MLGIFFMCVSGKFIFTTPITPITIGGGGGGV